MSHSYDLMRRLTLEFSVDEIIKFQSDPHLQDIESFEVLHIMRQDRNEFALICRVKLKDPSLRIEDLFRGDEVIEMQLLEKDKQGVCTYFFRGKPDHSSAAESIFLGLGVYLTQPYEIREGKARVTCLGSATQLKKFLRRIEKSGVPYKVVFLSDAKFSPNSPLNRLTDKQRRVIISAYDLGYYELPRRISSEALARKLNIRGSTLVLHRRKAEQKLLTEIIRQ